jgi:peptide/nickel transport system ATP-binding protein
MTPIISLAAISKRFTKPLDLAARIANVFGAHQQEIAVRAVDGVDLSINEGEVVGLVGESGCGKSTLGRIVAGIMPPSEGSISFHGTPMDALDEKQRKDAALTVQMIFQDPMASLNPRLRVTDIVGEAPVVHGLVTRAKRDEYVADMLRRVGLDPSYRNRYPHQFSGGQRARIGIARALAVQPKFLVCDESVAALDVSIQAQVLNLFMQLRRDLNLTLLFISHDLGVVQHLSDRVAIMYLGRIVELADARRAYANPLHPYTRALLDSIPKLVLAEDEIVSFKAISGELPSALSPPGGCHFHLRCPHAVDRCRGEIPPLREIAPAHWAACHLAPLG